MDFPASVRLPVYGFGLALAVGAPLRGQVVWNGGGSNDYWSTGANWQGGVAPATNGTASVAFAGSTRLTPYMDQYSTSVSGLSFNSGAGAFTLSGSGQLTVGSGGITQNSSTAQTISTNVAIGAAQTWSLAGNLTVNGALSGTSNVTLQSTSFAQSKLYLNGSNSYSGTLTLNSGTVVAGNTNALASATVSLNGGTLNYDSSLSQVSLGGIAGSGQLFFQNQNGSVTVSIGGNGQNSLYTGDLSESYNDGDMKWVGGTLYLTGNMGKSFTVANGTVDISGNLGTTFTSQFVTIQQYANLQVSRSTVTFTGNTYGAGMLNVTGTMIVTGSLGHTGGTTVNGDLQIGNLADGGNSGSITGNVTVNGSLEFNRNSAITYGGIISGTGPVSKSGTGALIFTGNNTYTGSTGVGNGTLQIGNGGTSGTVSSVIYNNSAVVFNRSNSYSYGGTISGLGAVTQAGSGTLTLSGNNTYSGGTTVTAGTLLLGGTHGLPSAGAVTLNGGILATGGLTPASTLGALTLASSSTIDFGTGTSALAFADSSGVSWSGTLAILNYTSGSDTLRFGSSSGGLTAAQLNAINFGSGLTAQIDGNGFVTGVAAIPEPSTYGLAGGVCALAVAFARRRRT